MSTVELNTSAERAGEAPRSLLLGSSLGTTLEMWAPALGSLERSHRVVRFDHRGHGASPVPDASLRDR